jgi:DNA-binding NarL/FixJ family response regulator
MTRQFAEKKSRMSEPIKVAVVEDDKRLREGLVFLINSTSEFCCIGSHPNAELALKQLPADWPDVVLMDINLPNMSGIDCVAKLKALRPALQVVMLTAYVDNEQIFKSLKAGASGYLIKKTPATEILEAITDAHRGGSPMTSSIARKVVEFFRQEPPEKETENLSKRELEILDLLAKGHRYKEIAEALSISFDTVRFHLRNIYEKLHVHSRTEAVVKYLGERSQ